MNCDDRNRLFLKDKWRKEDAWPKIREYRKSRYQFGFEFGLKDLPTEPGLISVRGARQTGKSTWMELSLYSTLENYGPGSAFILNGDELISDQEFEKKLLELEELFSPKIRIKRIFIDEITSILHWERVLKRLLDQGHFRDVLIISTGSNAADLRHGSEKLPGRKGKFARHEYLFLPISYREYLRQTGSEIGRSPSDSLSAYCMSGGSPLAISDMAESGQLPEPFVTLVQDWVLGDIVGSGRSRTFVLNTLRQLYRHGAGRISYTGLAREAGLANNSAALDYIERLADLMVVWPCLQWDPDRGTLLPRKPSKIPFINMGAATTFHPNGLRFFHEVQNLNGNQRGAFFEWVVAQELWRRTSLEAQSNKKAPTLAEPLAFWASDQHEIDFVVWPGQKNEAFFEVKAGPASADEFLWFPKGFPGKQLTVICETPFEAKSIRGVTLHEFLLDRRET